MTSDDLYALAERAGAALLQRNWKVTTAESCTGGWLAQAITSVAGSSAWFEAGFITYANLAKQRMLGVQSATLAAYGAVSEAVVQEMAHGALLSAQADCAIAISGIAGPGGGTAQKPVGTVCCAWVTQEQNVSRTFMFQGSRESIRRQSVVAALGGLLALLVPIQ